MSWAPGPCCRSQIRSRRHWGFQIGTLSKIANLTVLSRQAVLQYRDSDKTMVEIGRELGAGSIVEGSVRRDGNSVRVPYLHHDMRVASAVLQILLRAEALREEVEALRRSRRKVFQTPPVEWIEERLSRVQEVLERRTERSALLLRDVLGTIRLEPKRGDVGRPYYLAQPRSTASPYSNRRPGPKPWTAVRILRCSGGGGSDLVPRCARASVVSRVDGMLCDAGQAALLKPAYASSAHAESARVRLPPPVEPADPGSTKPLRPAWSQGPLVEAAGVEPASASGSGKVSTCVVRCGFRSGPASEQPSSGASRRLSLAPRRGSITGAPA